MFDGHVFVYIVCSMNTHTHTHTRIYVNMFICLFTRVSNLPSNMKWMYEDQLLKINIPNYVELTDEFFLSKDLF